MKARIVALAAALALAGCSSPAKHADPHLVDTGQESAVAVTVPGGPETLPTWQRQPDGTATLVVPADLLFATDSAALGDGIGPVLNTVVTEFGPGKRITVEGHADSDGTLEHNQQLSERRASAVAQWLIAHGVPSAAITTVGYGETRPAVDEVDDAAKAKNRRVVVTLTPSPTTTPPTVVVRAAGSPTQRS